MWQQQQVLLSKMQSHKRRLSPDELASVEQLTQPISHKIQQLAAKLLALLRHRTVQIQLQLEAREEAQLQQDLEAMFEYYDDQLCHCEGALTQTERTYLHIAQQHDLLR